MQKKKHKKNLSNNIIIDFKNLLKNDEIAPFVVEWIPTL